MIFEDMKLDDMSDSEVKRNFKLVKAMLQRGDDVRDYLMFTS